VFRLRPPEKSSVPENPLRRRAYYLVTSARFDNMLMGIIMLSVTTMALSFYTQTDEYERALENVATALSAIFALEAVLKITGLTWASYWKNNWNKFDLFLVLTSLVDVAAAFLSTNFLRVLRILRLQRLLRLLRVMKSLKARARRRGAPGRRREGSARRRSPAARGASHGAWGGGQCTLPPPGCRRCCRH